MKLSELPEGCISHILSFTSPMDVIRSSILCKLFLSASKSDAIWVKFLPSDSQLNLIISQSSTPPLHQQFDSKKDHFLHLCNSPLLFNNQTHSFALDKGSGKKCYMLGARVLSITWGHTPDYWTWESIPESRFPESAVLLNVCWLDIKGRMQTKFLSRSTTYGVYFVFKMENYGHYGFENVPIKAYVNETDEERLMLSEENMNAHQNDIFRTFYLETENDEGDLRNPEELPVERGDGWMEIEMGRYQVADDFGGDETLVLEMTVKEVEMLNWKNGLIVQGIELRPLE